MTVTTTPRENLSPHNGRVPGLDSPAVRARARARVAVTDRNGNRERVSRILRPGKWAVPHWRTWLIRPDMLRDLWQQSAIDRTRIPDNNTALRWAWQVSNWTDRLLLLAVITALPAPATPGLRWAVLRPTRRHAIYLTLTALTAAYLTGRN